VTLSWTACLVLSLTVPAAPQTPAAPARDRDVLQRLVEDGNAAIRGGNPARALEVFERATRDAERLADQELLASSLVGLGWAQWANGKYAESLQTRARALEIARRRGARAQEALLLKGLGETYYGLGRYDDALAQYRLALEVLQQAPNPAERALVLSNMGSAYRNLGRYDDSASTLQEALAIARPLGSPGPLSQILTFLGIVSRARGEYDRALEYYGEALAFTRKMGNRRSEAQILGNTGNVYVDLGRYARAAELFRESLAIAEAIGYAAQVGFAHQNLGNAMASVGRTGDAASELEAALAVWRKLDRRPQIAFTLHALGALRLFQLDDLNGARRALEESLAVAREIKEADAESLALIDLGWVALRSGEAALALHRADEALAIARERAGPDVQYQALTARGAALRRLGRIDDAIAALRASADIVNDLRANVSSDESKIAYLDTKQAVFHDLADILMSAGRADEALEAAEAGRARALADLLRDRQIRGKPQHREALATWRQAVGRQAAAGALDEAMRALRAQSRELASLASADTLHAADMRRTAARLNAVIVEYLVTDDALLAWVVDSERIRGVRTETDTRRLTALVRELLDELNDGVETAGRSRLSAGLRELHRTVIAPIERWLPASSDDLVLLVPHAALALAPFAAMIDDSGTPVVDRHTLAFAPALSVFQFTAEKAMPPVKGASALIVADPPPPEDSGLPPLAGARAEATRVARRLVGARVELITGSQATETAVKRAAAGRQLIHFATHGLISEQRPLASALVLGKGTGDDGYLRADEIFQLDLDARLVVLSGCSTGRGRLTGDGIVGLSRAFMYAGTPTLVVSHWDVSDAATADLMDRFYEGLARGLGPASALARAQRASRRLHPHPGLWAAFAVIGEPR
jgi:CHAT domain-containing protein